MVRICPHGRGPFKIGVVSDEGKHPVIGDVEGGELRRFPFLFPVVLRGAFDPCSNFLFVRGGSLWQVCCSGQLSSLFVRRPRYSPPEWSICLPTDIVFPWLQVDQGKGTGKKR